MGDVVNLRQVRKQKKRTDKQKKAESNRLSFGRPKVERDRQKAQETLEAKRLEGHRLGKDQDQDD